MTIYGYASATDDKTDFNAQLDALRAAGCAKYVVDYIASPNNDRPELAVVLSQLTADDRLVVQSLSRLAASHWRLIEVIQAIKAAGAHFVSTDDRINTESPSGKRFFAAIDALHRFDQDITKIYDGRTRSRGRKGGRKPLDSDIYRRIADRHADPTLVVADFCKELRISRGTFYKYSNLIAEAKAKKRA